jgi:LAO/AO transport system kinase
VISPRSCKELSDRVTLSRVLSLAESNPAEVLVELSSCLPREPRAVVVGVTGPQGVGKSTIISSLVRELNDGRRRVAALLVDPLSPLTGGAVLGNRLRMPELPDSAFARSVWAEDERALPLRAIASLEILEAAGYDYILVETPGAGQVNTSVLRVSDLVLVVLMPFLGDEVQVIKAGMMEVGDIYVVNKADVPEADLMYGYVKSLVKEKPVVKVSALYRKNLRELVETMDAEVSRKDREGERVRKRFERRKYLVEEALLEELQHKIREELKEVNYPDLLSKPETLPETIRGLKTKLSKKLLEGP